MKFSDLIFVVVVAVFVVILVTLHMWEKCPALIPFLTLLAKFLHLKLSWAN